MCLAVGQKMRLAPYELVTRLGAKIPSSTTKPCKIIYINWRHRYFTVEFEFGNHVVRESYKFSFRGWIANEDEKIIWHGGMGNG